MEINWAEFKAFVSSRSLSIQWVVYNNNYHLKAFDGYFSLSCILPIDSNQSDTLDFETNFKSNGNKTQPQQQQPFASKSLPNGKKLYKREHGIQATVNQGVNNIIFTVPYNWVKIIGMEIVNGENLDTCNLYILDSISGAYSTIPNYQLNQFGFNVNITKDIYEEENAYDADLYIGMQIKVEYTSQTNKTIGLNFNLSEVK